MTVVDVEEDVAIEKVLLLGDTEGIGVFIIDIGSIPGPWSPDPARRLITNSVNSSS